MNTVRRFRPAVVILRFLALLCALDFTAAAQTQDPELVIDRTVLDGTNAANMLAPSSMALDTWRGLLYVLSDRSPRIAVLDPVTGRRFPDILLPAELRGTVQLLAVNPRSRLLLLQERRGASLALLAADVYTGAVAARFDAGNAPFLHIERDPARDELYLSRGTRGILRLDGTTLAPLDSLSCDAATAGLAVDSLHRVLYAAGAEADAGTTTLVLFSTQTRERLRSYTLPADTPMTRVAVDPVLQTVALIGGGLIRLFDASGLPLYTERVSGGMGPHAMSPTFHQLLYLDRDHAEGPGIFGTRRRLHRFRMDETDFDSVAAGPGPSSLAVIEPALEAVVLCSDAAAVEVYDVLSLALKRTLRLGRSTESIAATADGNGLFLASARGPASVMTRVDLHMLKSTDHPVGSVPVQVALDPSSGSIVALLDHENRFLLLDPETGATEESFVIQDVGESRDPAYPSFALDSSGLLLALFPAQNLQALVNTGTKKRLRLGRVDGYVPAPYAGAGALQGVFVPGTRLYAILRLQERKVNLYSVDAPGLVKVIDLGQLDWSRVQPFERFCLRPGPRGGVFFIGPYSYDAVSERWALAIPDTSVLISGCDMRSCIALQKTAAGGGLTLLYLTSDSLRPLRSNRLLPGYPAPDALQYHAGTHRLFLAFSDSGLILVFSVDEGSEVPAWSTQFPAATEVYPNPASLSRHRFLLFRMDAGSSATLADLLGRVLWNAETADRDGGFLRIPLEYLHPAPGCYVLSIRSGQRLTVANIRILP